MTCLIRLLLLSALSVDSSESALGAEFCYFEDTQANIVALIDNNGSVVVKLSTMHGVTARFSMQAALKLLIAIIWVFSIRSDIVATITIPKRSCIN